MNNLKAIGEAPKSTRMSALAGAAKESRIVRDGGMFSAGLIREVSAMTEGEALGHEAWVDGTMLDQLVAQGNAIKNGVKSRFTHPGLSSDGLGKLEGRFMNFSRSGNKAIGDLHLVKSAHETPSGNLAKYAMDLAEESPDLFATSIVFQRDIGAERAFEGEHSDKKGRFTSPDKKNAENFPHFRLDELMAVDLVDEPAANPGGLFSAMGDGNELPAQAFEVLDFAFGISDDPPEPLMGIHPERVKNTFQSYLEARKISTVFEKPEDETSDACSGITTTYIRHETPENWEYTIHADGTGTTTESESNKEPDPTGAVSHLKEGEESEMDDLIKNLTAEQLGEERPDLVKKLQADLRAELDGKAKEQLKAETARCVGIVEAGEKLGLVDGISERLTSCQSVSEATIELQGVKLAQYASGTLPAAEIEGTASADTHKTETPKPEKPDNLSYDEKFDALMKKYQAEGLDAYAAGLRAEDELKKEEDK